MQKKEQGLINSPKLTVLIPTLNRPDTLYYTLQTVVNQSYSNFQIVVSDNYSNDNTKEIVDSFANNNIQYINPGKRLSMSHHWEFALQHVRDGYVTILGDDDGLLQGGLQKVADLIIKHKVPAIGWRFGNFNWKGLPPYFMIPMANYYRVVNAKQEIEAIFKQSIYRTIQFPSFYGGFIDIDLFKSLRNKNGVFFHSRIPDFFTGGTIAANVNKYIRAEFPISINATSKHSTGYATINEKADQKAFNDLRKQDDNIPFHKDLIFYRSNAIPIAEAMLQVHELNPSFPGVDIKKLLAEVATEAISVKSRDVYNELIDGIKHIADINNLRTYADELIKNISHQPKPDVVKKKFSPLSQTLYIDTSKTGIDTIEDACTIASQVIPSNYFEAKNQLGINYSRLNATSRYFFLKFLGSKKHLAHYNLENGL